MVTNWSQVFCVYLCFQELHLGNNLLTVFDSAQLKCLTSLSILDVRDNKISVVPEEITTLISLERLDITNNDVST